MGALTGRAVQAIGKGAFVGALFQFNRFLGFAALYGLSLTEYYRKQQEHDKVSIARILGETTEILGAQCLCQKLWINRFFNDSETEEDEGAQVLNEDNYSLNIQGVDAETYQLARERLSKEKFLNLVPDLEVPSWDQLSVEQKINMAFLQTGISIFALPGENEAQKSWWVKQFVALCQENASLEERKQLALDYLRSY